MISFCTGLQDSWYIVDSNFANQIIPWFRQILLFEQLKFQWLCSACLSFLSWWKCGGSGKNLHISEKNFQEIEIFPKPTPKTQTLGSKEKAFSKFGKYQSQEKYMGIAWKASGKMVHKVTFSQGRWVRSKILNASFSNSRWLLGLTLKQYSRVS